MKIFVLQGLRRDYIAIGRICIARLEGYCRLGKAVSRYKNCIVTEVVGLASFWLQYKRIVLWLGSRRALGCWGMQAWALGRAGVGAGARRRGRWAGRWVSRRAAGAGRAWARGRALQATGRVGARRSGRAEQAGARQAEHAADGGRGRRSARQAGRVAAGARGAHGRAGARGRRRQGRAGRSTGRPVRTWVCSAGPGWGYVYD